MKSDEEEGRPSKSYTHVITSASRYVAWKKFRGDTPTGLEVIGAHAEFYAKFLIFTYFWGGGEGPVLVGVCSSKPG